MSFPTNWDVSKYKTNYESDEHWELRRKFIETHKERFPEDKLICLAQVFFNIEFLGCRLVIGERVKLFCFGVCCNCYFNVH